MPDDDWCLDPEDFEVSPNGMDDAGVLMTGRHSTFIFEHMKCSDNLEHDSGRARHRAQRNRAKKDRRSQREAEPELVDPATAVGACGLAITSSSEGDANSQHPLVAVAAAWKALGEPLAAPD